MSPQHLSMRRFSAVLISGALAFNAVTSTMHVANGEGMLLFLGLAETSRSLVLLVCIAVAAAVPVPAAAPLVLNRVRRTFQVNGELG
jgi:hypothetical protein